MFLTVIILSIKMQVASNEKGRSPLSSQINLDFTPKRSETSWTDMRVE